MTRIKQHVRNLARRTLSSACVAFGLLHISGATALAAGPISPLDAPHPAVYRWGAPKGPGQVDAFGTWVGSTNVWGEDFEANDRWDNLSSPGWQLGPWQDWIKANPQRRLILSVPMLPGAWDRSGTGQGEGAHEPVSLDAGARGDYNQHFKTLAEQLVAHKLDHSIIRLGWEFNGGWYTWRGSDNPAAWVKFFQQIVTTMRSVKGADKLIFCWNPATDYQQFPAEQAWPGDQYVDLIGIDVYDQSWLGDTYPIPADATDEIRLARQKKAWNDWTYGGNHGLKFWLDFRREHKKPMAVCEWGLCLRGDGHGGGDDPFFVQQMHDVINDPANKILFHCYFDVQAGDGHHQISPGSGANATPEFPKATELYLKLFGTTAASK